MTALFFAVLSAATLATPVPVRAADCGDLERRTARQLTAESARQREGGDAESAPEVDFATVFRVCFQQRIYPALKRGETNEAEFKPAVTDYFAWRRSTMLLGLENDYDAEDRQAHGSIETGLRNYYAKARARCLRRPDQTAVAQMIEMARFAVLAGFGEDFFPTLDADIQACAQSGLYRITVRERDVTSKHGTTYDVTYDVVMGRDRAGDPGALVGSGSYSGSIKGSYGDPEDGNACYTKLRSYPVGGMLEASGGAMPSGSRTYFLFNLQTTDWIYGGIPVAGRFVALVGVPDDAEQIEATKAGGGTTGNFELTGPVTHVKEEAVVSSHECTGSVRHISEITVRQLK